MFLPSADQYSSAIQQKAFSSLYFLNDHHFLSSNDQGSASRLIFHQGQNAVIFKATHEGKPHAIRCFLSGEHETFRRYSILAEFFSEQPLPWFASFEFMEKEIFVDGIQYPLLQMEWVEGESFHAYLDRKCHDREAISSMQQKINALSEGLEKNGIGHGDINLSHLMVVKGKDGDELKLVDYDSVFFPEFNGLRSLGAGSPGFQHPCRLATDFSPAIDRFSIWIFLAGLEAVKKDPSLWENATSLGYHKNQNLLFSFRDLLFPTQSRIFRKLHALKDDAIDFYIGNIMRFCEAEGPAGVDVPMLYEDRLPSPKKTEEPLKIQPADLPQKEVHTIPQGRNVAANGTSPIKLNKVEKDLTRVEVQNEAQRKMPEINAGNQAVIINMAGEEKKDKQGTILSFHADHYRVLQGELVTLNWDLTGEEPAYITNVGKLNERSGQKQLVLTHTTKFELRSGKEKKSVTIAVDQKKTEEPATAGKRPRLRKLNDRQKKWVLPTALLCVLAISSLVYWNLPDAAEKLPASLPVQEAALNLPASSGIFVPATVRTSMQKLYDAYNRRDLASIMSHYSSRLHEYYDSRNIARDSLSKIIRNLFITPAFYHCEVDKESFVVKDQGTSCLVRATLHETIQREANGKKESYQTEVEYRLNTNMKIVAEKMQQ